MKRWKCLMPTSRATAAKGSSVEAIARRYLELAQRFPLADHLRPDGPPLSYTQWEAWLALLHGMNRMGCSRLTWPARVQKARKAYRPRSGNSWQRGLDHGRTWENKPSSAYRGCDTSPCSPHRRGMTSIWIVRADGWSSWRPGKGTTSNFLLI